MGLGCAALAIGNEKNYNESFLKAKRNLERKDASLMSAQDSYLDEVLSESKSETSEDRDRKQRLLRGAKVDYNKITKMMLTACNVRRDPLPANNFQRARNGIGGGNLQTYQVTFKPRSPSKNAEFYTPESQIQMLTKHPR